jgi:glycosyltransferase involved in cell wall biosynthesis
MRILVIHNHYQHAGGEDAVVNAEKDLLIQNGHEVNLLICKNDDIAGLWKKARTAINVTYSSAWRKRVRREITRFRPDLVHVHNFFPMITPSVYDACSDMNVPVVQTLHNYRTICPGALLMRNGKICETCVTHSPYWSVAFGCYRSSRLGTLAVARMVQRHLKQGTWWKKTSRIIVLTEFAKRKFIEGGFPEDRISVKPNFVPDTFTGPQSQAKENHDKGDNALFVGRLSVEKGITTLLRACETANIKLHIAGDGPLLPMVQALKENIVNHLGVQSKEQVYSEMHRAAFLAMPSECYEGFPMVLAEAFSVGLPVVASQLGSMAEIVEDCVTGLHFEPGNPEDLAKKMQWMLSHPEDRRRMGQNARRAYEERYTPEVSYRQLMDIYNFAIGGM